MSTLDFIPIFKLIHIFSEPTESDEHVLCTIRYDANGVLSVRPDFNKTRKAYRIETQGMGRGGFLIMFQSLITVMGRMESPDSDSNSTDSWSI